MSFGSRIKGEVSTCCNAQVWREPKISGYKPYCDKCRKPCEIKEIQIRGVTYSVGDVVALIGYNEYKGYTAVMRIDKFHQDGGHIGEYQDGEKIYTANAHYIGSLAADAEIIAEMERRKREKLSGVL